ncbi:phage holin family protein [Xenorhabdus griffiniae]|uniref:Phage holin family protein n=1 Tax=Xenorhabdus griffiniae TaxID=351672 RepID=A0ABY9XKY7_9GAMM|nr:phage holin family protein [Xenorhabdus griffiniae]MBD1229314.1 phage holin family protein [Xenorhabdus griffiniae]MBE8588459.1 phage holin family protein [Xenorhabdus griffiniae]WMV73588.1 phage holin family protein [Xenorhabdus griffiniae]WNH03268.1 phage holin family protein [Xenorhabdus griffiniae]
MEEHEKTFVTLVLLGALIALGKMLTGNEPITLRLFIGRVILGSAVSVMAGALLIWWPGISPVAVTGIGSALGIAGYQLVEVWLQKRGSALLTGKLKQ